MLLKIERFAYTPYGVFGYMPQCDLFTLERPWIQNQVGVSCIPNGRYELKRGYFNRGGYACYEVLNVPGRSLIKFHRGNNVRDVEGCIAVGQALNSGSWGIVNSREGFGHFMRHADAMGFDEVVFMPKLEGDV